MASKIRQIADELTMLINVNPWTLPLSVHSPLAKAGIYPLVSREEGEGLRIFVTFNSAELDPTQKRDRCDPSWVRNLFVIIEKPLTKPYSDADQPGDLDEIDECIEFTEELAEYLANNRAVGGMHLREIEVVSLCDEERLVGSDMYFSQMNVSYGV